MISNYKLMEFLPHVYENISLNWNAKILYGAFHICRNRLIGTQIGDMWKIVYNDKIYFVDIFCDQYRERIVGWSNGVKLSATETEKIISPKMYKEIIWFLPQPIAEEIWNEFRTI